MVKIMENPIKIDDLGGFPPYFWKHPHGIPMCFLLKSINQSFVGNLSRVDVLGPFAANTHREALNFGAILGGEIKIPMTDPWDERYIYLHEWLIFMVNVGKYTNICLHE